MPQAQATLNMLRTLPGTYSWVSQVRLAAVLKVVIRMGPQPLSTHCFHTILLCFVLVLALF